MFILSQFPKTEISSLINKIKRLGGKVIDSSQFDSKATICLYYGLPIRNEKILCSIAAGLHVLPADYVNSSFDTSNKTLLDPSTYDMGNAKRN